jgi:hypothetical protein
MTDVEDVASVYGMLLRRRWRDGVEILTLSIFSSKPDSKRVNNGEFGEV